MIGLPPPDQEKYMSNNAVVWFEIYVNDLQRAKAFYEAVFTVSLEKLGDDDVDGWMFPCKEENAGAGGALFKFKKQDMPVGPGGTTVYFGCEDCAVEQARAVANGGAVILSKMSIGEHGFCAVVRDTEGNHIGLHSMK